MSRAFCKNRKRFWIIILYVLDTRAGAGGSLESNYSTSFREEKTLIYFNIEIANTYARLDDKAIFFTPHFVSYGLQC